MCVVCFTMKFLFSINIFVNFTPKFCNFYTGFFYFTKYIFLMVLHTIGFRKVSTVNDLIGAALLTSMPYSPRRFRFFPGVSTSPGLLRDHLEAVRVCVHTVQSLHSRDIHTQLAQLLKVIPLGKDGERVNSRNGDFVHQPNEYKSPQTRGSVYSAVPAVSSHLRQVNVNGWELRRVARDTQSNEIREATTKLHSRNPPRPSSEYICIPLILGPGKPTRPSRSHFANGIFRQLESISR